MKVLVTGATGQLGSDVCQVLLSRGISYVGVGSAGCDITDGDAVQKLFRQEKPDAVIHCAAYTKVDQAEDEPEKCRAINVDGTRNIVEECRRLNSKLLYVSTDYVFPGSGARFYEPDDPTGPLNVYGSTKLDGELMVREFIENYFIVRTSWVFGKNGANFVKAMLKLSETKTELNVVCDQIGSPTYTADLALLLCDMIASEKYGVYHATNEGVCSWAEFAEEIFRQTAKNINVKHILSSEYPTNALRPQNSRLSKVCLEENGFSRLPHWKEALQRYWDGVQWHRDEKMLESQ